ncbi:MAG: polysaccharide biosynthesis protein, partial [Pedobacter sp.]
MFGKINIVPRWIIFLLDLGVCLVSLTIAYFLKFNFDLSDLSFVEFSRNILILTLINIVVFFNVKTYAGIIRYTSAQDTFRILFAVLTANGIFFFLNLGVIAFGKTPYISNTIIIVNGLTSFLLLITYRVMIKYFFLYIKNLSLDKKKVIIYGAGEAGLATKRTFDHDGKVNKTIIAFVDDDERKVGKTIDGIKILAAKKLEDLISEHEVDEIIFASYTIPVERKNEIVDVCLENDVTVLNIPPADVWAKGNISTAQIQNINIEDLLNRKPIEIN